MNEKQARYIRAIAREGSVTGVARQLYISQPSLSQMLRQVEEELGVALFDRSSQPLRPTYAGERYLKAAETILLAQEQLENELREIREENSGRLRLGISMQRAAHLLPRVLPRFLGDYPKVSLALHEGGSASLEEMVLEGRVDVALASTRPGRSGLEYRLLQRETIGVLAGADSPLARRMPWGTAIALDQALDAPFVALKPGHNVRVIQERLFRAMGVQPRLLLETDSMEAARQITLSCGCYLLCANSYPEEAGAFFPLNDYENDRHFYACHRAGQRQPQFVQAFLDLVAEVCRGEGAPPPGDSGGAV